MTTRYEKVVLQLEDNFSRGALTAAGSAKVLDKALDGTGSTSRRMGSDFDKSGSSIDKLSGRLGLLAKTAGALGPALVPIGAAAAPAVAGLTASLGATALGAGAVMLAFKGMGDVMKAVDKAQIDPTTENIEKAKEALASLPPEARRAAKAMQDFQGVISDIQYASAKGFLPGFVLGLEDLKAMAPQLERIMGTVANAAGGLFSDATEALSGPEFFDFFDFLEREAAPKLTEFGHTLGNVGKGIAELIMAADPLSDDFGAGLLKASESFAAWADGLTATEGYREFIDYVRETGPQVVETVGSLANGLLQIAEAAAPLGGPVLQGIELFADAVATIADSPLGPPIMEAVTAMSALSLATKALGIQANLSFGQLLTGARAARVAAVDPLIAGLGRAETAMAAGRRIRSAAPAAVGIGAVAGANAAGLDTTYTILGAMAGSVIPGVGTAAGAAAGSLLDMASAFKESEDAARGFDGALASGDPDQIRAAVEEKQREVDDYTGSLRSKIAGALSFMGPQSDSAYTNTGQLARGRDALTGAERKLAAAQQDEAEAAGYATHIQYQHAQSLTAVHDAALKAANSELGWKQAMLDAAEAVRENGRVVDANGNALKGHEQAAIDSEKAILGVAAAWNDQARAGDGTQKELDATKAAIRRMAAQAGFGEGEIRKMIRALDAVPPKTNAQVEVEGTDRALDAIARIRGQLNQIPREIRTAYYVNQINSVNSAGSLAPGGERRKAGGGPIYGPGTATSDSIPAMLSNGEYVIRAAAVRQYGVGFFDRANQMRLASGGHVGRDDDGVRELGKAARETAKAMREERKARLENLRSERVSVQSAVRDRFRSDIFAAPDNAWAGSKSDWRSRLNADIAQARSVNKATATLKRKGLDGNALADLLQNADVSQIRGFASMSSRQLASYERLYNARDRASSIAGRAAGNAAYGKQIADIQKELRGLRKAVNDSADRNAAKITDGVNGAARSGARRGGRR